MGDEKSLVKITPKYHCMVTGKNQMEPCDGCSNPKGCLSRAMQYKENETMDEMDEKAVVKIDADGGVVKCAKGLDAGECGFKAGSKVCGACGAMAVSAKSEYMEEEEEEDEEKAVPTPEMPEDEEDEEDEAPAPMAEEAPEAEAEAEAAPADEEEPPVRMRRRQGEAMMADEDEDKTWMMQPDKNSRRRAMNSMGMKSGEFDDNSYICQLQRKVYPGSTDICENCPGGCQSEAGMPGLVEVEGTALSILGGKVLDSGYSFDADIFVVQVQAKNGKTYEYLGDGQTGELLELKRLRDAESGIEGKSLESFDDYTNVISASDAVEIALKSLNAEFGVSGDVVAADSDIFLGHDVYAVEIDAVNGKSYDVYVTLDGQFVGLDEWTAEEAEEIEAEAAEIALKRAYSDESREEMAKEGMALPDGSYPIKDVADLRNAIQAFGRAKDKEAAKRHIMKRAMDLGAEDLIPENWVPESAKKRAQGEKTDESETSSDEFIASLMEFELLTQEQDLKDII